MTRSKKIVKPVRVQPKRSATSISIEPKAPPSPEHNEEADDVILSNTQD
jgi:hypothetical protein